MNSPLEIDIIKELDACLADGDVPAGIAFVRAWAEAWFAVHEDGPVPLVVYSMLGHIAGWAMAQNDDEALGLKGPGLLSPEQRNLLIGEIDALSTNLQFSQRFDDAARRVGVGSA